MWEVSQALVLYELGGVIQGGENYNLHTVYEYTDSTTPVVFILPSDVHDGSADDSTKGEVGLVLHHRTITYQSDTRGVFQ